MKNEEAGYLSVHLTVSGDGTWKKRGFSSLFGISTLVGMYKRVLDTVVESNSCQGCNLWKTKKKGTIDDYSDWYEDHKEQCTINHVGSAGKMKGDANFRDEIREHSRRRSTEIAKRARSTSREEKSALQDFYEHEESPLYGPGLAD
ncbi:hypothetical protein QLX08_011373 [Tetragonisca angustula]|uniref:Mutator-like transposase domain-containing protein n=1 Tax=Tetragonisca angustula TaxID=166442 RepID=A0AAW0Z8L0_9HYME